jgi:O-antigen ligase
MWTWVWCACFLGAFLQSLSRSFLVGFVAGAFVLFGYWLLGGKESWRTWGVVARRKMALLGSFGVAAATLWVLVSFPFPARPDLTNSPFYRGDNDDTRSLAVSSRWNMLDPMLDAIAEAPMLGEGFGKELTYISDDPRIKEMTGGTGELTTYRFEWGFLDVWMKMGIFGLVAYVWILGALLAQGGKNIRAQGMWSFSAVRERWLEIGLVSGVVMIYATHMFTPYLNHPIGLMYLLFVAYMISWKGSNIQKKEAQTIRGEQRLFGTAMPLGVSARDAQ